jgi:hypothetical protein
MNFTISKVSLVALHDTLLLKYRKGIEAVSSADLLDVQDRQTIFMVKGAS